MNILSVAFACLLSACLACNMYIEGQPEISYLCKDQKCDAQNIKDGMQCQSGCCWEGLCNADGKCAEQQLTYAVIAIAVISVIGAAIFFVVWYFYLRHLTKRREEAQAAQKAKMAKSVD